MCLFFELAKQDSKKGRARLSPIAREIAGANIDNILYMSKKKIKNINIFVKMQKNPRVMFPGFSVQLRHSLAHHKSLAVECHAPRSSTHQSRDSQCDDDGSLRPQSPMPP